MRHDVINKEEKDVRSYSQFQKKIKPKLLEIKMTLIIFNETLIILKSKISFQSTVKTKLESPQGLTIKQKAFCKSHSLNLK